MLRPLNIDEQLRLTPFVQDHTLTVLCGTSRYSAVLREAIASATEGVVEPLGDRLAIRVDLPVVELPNRPPRAGRHFLVFVGTGTVSVDCIWEPEKAALVEAACATVAANFATP